MGNRLDFLYDLKLPDGTKLPGYDLHNLLSDEEFVKKISSHIYSEITPEIILSELKLIYFPIKRDYETENFKKNYKKEHGNDAYREWSRRHRDIGRAYRKISKKVYHEDKYLEDYEEWKQNNTKSEEPEA